MNTSNRIVFASTDSKNMRNTRLGALERYWDEKRGAAAMPSRAQIDPLEIARLLPIVLIGEIIDNETYIRLLGSETTAVYGKEARGRPVSDLSFGAFTPAWTEAFASIREGASRAAASGFYSSGVITYSVDTVLLPLCDSGQQLRYIFGGLIVKPACRNGLDQKPPAKSFIIEPRYDKKRDLPAARTCTAPGSFGAGQE